MRIIIDTDMQAIIVPESYYMQVDKLNEVIQEAGGKKLDYTQYIKSCFEKAYNTQIIRQTDVVKMKATKKRRPSVQVQEQTEEKTEKKDEKKEEKKAEEKTEKKTEEKKQ